MLTRSSASKQSRPGHRRRLRASVVLRSAQSRATPRHRAAFLRIAGRRLASHSSWAALSARASRLRGRCTEKPSRRNLGPLRSRHNLIDPGGSDLPDEPAINPRDHVLAKAVPSIA